jgi:hypothetical protein
MSFVRPGKYGDFDSYFIGLLQRERGELNIRNAIEVWIYGFDGFQSH